jgi:hypothetical protein
MVDENVKGKADVKLSVKAKPLAGVTIPQFTIRDVDEEKCKKKFFNKQINK